MRNHPVQPPRSRLNAGFFLSDDVALADSQPPEHLDGPSRHAWVAQLRIMVDARKWTAFADRVDVEVGHQQISIRGALEAAQARLLNMDG